ncbi:MAG: M12 family metallo-peptidase [Saprospiraceae bacterium]|nr:M12 family metallo-peptidase [Saprospiraceae bacterium]
MTLINYKALLSLICMTVLTTILSNEMVAQDQPFHPVEKQAVSHLMAAPDATILPQRFQPFKVSLADFMKKMKEEAPEEFTTNEGYRIIIPMPDGKMKKFEVWYSPCMQSGLQQKYPDIRSYAGRSDQGDRMRLTVTPRGIKAAIRSTDSYIYIDPIVEDKTEMHAVYNIRDFDTELWQLGTAFECGTKNDGLNPLEGLDLDHIEGGLELRSAGDPVGIRTFRTAIATTGEWTLLEGGKANAVAKVVASVDRANVVFESEAAIRLVLVDNNDEIVFDDPDTDPYSGGTNKSGRDLININTGHVNRIIGVDNYDVGHIFAPRCTDVGGVARRSSVCDDNNKAAGATCWANRNLEITVVRIFCHELGHQFACQHTFNHCDMENESLSTGYEPGSGSTIMSYAGLCGNQNVQSAADEYFHANSVRVMFGFSRSISCGDEIMTGNSRPDVSFDMEDNFAIPVSTPFFLKSTGSDNEGDNLTYCIEQHDAGTKICNYGQPEGSCPAFRSYPPTQEDYRIFPRFNKIWNNLTGGDRSEVLVDYGREFNFVVTARDNNAEVGGFGMDTITFEATDQAGPFVVTYPDNGEELTANAYEQITWDVANTDVAPVSCQEVDILLHVSNDFEDYRILKSSTENDGSEWVKIPDDIMENVRVTVVASDNIFFDISNQNSDIVPSTDTTYSLGLSPNSAKICLPDVFTAEIEASSLGGYQGSLTLEVVDGLPAEATHSFSSNTIDATGTSTLIIDLTEVTENLSTTVVVEAIGDNGDTLKRNIELTIVRSDFSSLEAMEPSDGSAGVGQNTQLVWNDVPDADSYDVQLATNPAFGAGSIVEEFMDITNTNVNLTSPLEKNTIYYWRVRAKNECGDGDYIVAAAFSTESAICNEYEAPDKDRRIPTGGVTSSELEIDIDSDIVDLNVSKIDFFCDFLSDATVSLQSPEGTEVVLIDRDCINTTEMDCGFDDDATRGIRCPPNTGEVFRPEGKLSDFNGENALGTWNLNMDISNNALSSELGEWFLEICTNASAEGPVLIINDTLKTKPGENNPIESVILRSEDNESGPENINYVLTTVPQEGDLELSGTPLSAGMSFTQADVNSGRVSYAHTGTEDVIDHFVFTVNDGEGGFTGSHIFDIDVNEANPSSTRNLRFENLFDLFPNPTAGISSLVFNTPLANKMSVNVTDLNGKVIRSYTAESGASSLFIELTDAVSGVYIVRAYDNSRHYYQKLTVQ